MIATKAKPLPKGNGILLTFFCTLLAVLLLTRGAAVGEGARSGLRLCGEVVVPSLFPFMVLAGFVATSRVSAVLGVVLRPLTKYLLRLPASAATPLLMGLIGGYPVGARTLTALVAQKQLSTQAAARMLCSCVNAGPAFLLCAVGAGMFGSLQIGSLLLAAQLASALCIGIVLGLCAPRAAQGEPAAPRYRPYSFCFVQAVHDACSGILSISAFVVAFSAVTALLASAGAITALTGLIFRLFPAWDGGFIEACVYGALEVVTGCKALSVFGCSGMFAAAALLSFSGISVIFQVLAVLHGSGISTVPFLFSRLVHSGLTLAFFALLLRIFPQAVATALLFSRPVHTTAGSAGGAASLLLMCAVFVLTVGRGQATPA